MTLRRPGIYLWRNLVNGKVYVGSSISVGRRRVEHVHRLKRGTEGNEYFQRAWNKHGRENFEFVVLEECSAEDRLKREQYWIDKFNATDERYGYNLIPTRKDQLYGAALSKYQKLGWNKYTPEERKQLNLHLNNPEAKKVALDRSNEVKKLPPWRKIMEPTWKKLRDKWADPVEAAKIVAAQNAGRARARLKRLLRERGKLLNDDIVRPTVKKKPLK